MMSVAASVQVISFAIMFALLLSWGTTEHVEHTTSAREWPEHACLHDDDVHVTSSFEWPEHACPHVDYVHVTGACDWPEHACPHDDDVPVKGWMPTTIEPVLQDRCRVWG